MLGTIGHLLILVAFVACAISGAAFFRAAQREERAPAWTPVGRGAWYAMTAALVAASGVLFYLLLTHQFQFAYVYQHSSRELPLKYLVSTFWAGQEGSFLLWILMTSFIGGALLWLAPRSYRAPVMSVVALCQVFMISMVVGLQFGPVAIGSSPFSSLAEAFPQAPIFQQNPDFIPADGTGLNDLLQNPWMVIHPPTLFVGFASMIVPFAFAVAALWKRQYTQWVRPALPWTLFGVMILGVGIAMGGYWAYVTLNFGGYWAWDPVENSSLVPWLVGIAALHTMLVQKKSGSSHKAALLLSITAFMLIVYSTFLTRSGILGDVSVHSFVDLGLNNQLLVWITTMGAVGFGLFAYRYRELPTPDREPRFLSREFMMFSGAMLICAAAAVIILGTSSPIFGRLFRDSPSGVPLEFYNKWTIPLAVGFVFLIGLGQLFWWTKMSIENLNRVLAKPIGLAVASTVAVLLLTPFVEQTLQPAALGAQPEMAQAGLLSGLEQFWAVYGQGLLLLLLLFASFFALYGNGLVLWRVGRGNPKMAGGALSHVGFALLVLGVIASSGFNNPIAPAEMARTEDGRTVPRENFILARGETRTVEGYRVTYADRTETERGRGQYILNFEDTRNGRSFTLKPIAYQGAGEQWFMHPDLKMYAEKDIYASVTPRAATGVDDEGGGAGELSLTRGDSTVIGEGRYAVSFKGYDTNVDAATLPDSADIAVAATVDVTNLETGERRRATPVYVIMNDRTERFRPAPFEDWDLTLTFSSMNVDNGAATFTVEGADVMPEDWLVVQAYEKPFIGLLWMGIILLSGGFMLALVRRTRDIAFSQNRG